MIESLEIHDVESATSPTILEKSLLLFLYLIYSLMILSILPAIIILVVHYSREKRYDHQRHKSKNKKLHYYNTSQPVPLFSLSEIIHATKLSAYPDFGREKSVFESLQEPKDLFVTLLRVSLPRDSGLVLHEKGEPRLLVRTIDAPFLTDFASIPLGARTGAHTRAAIVHDWAYSYYPLRTHKGRRICDLEMLEIMRADKCTPFVRAIIYSGLRLFGGMAFLNAPAARKTNNRFVESREYRNFHAHLLRHMFSYITGYFEGYGVLKEGSGEELDKEFEKRKVSKII